MILKRICFNAGVQNEEWGTQNQKLVVFAGIGLHIQLLPPSL